MFMIINREGDAWLLSRQVPSSAHQRPTRWEADEKVVRRCWLWGEWWEWWLKNAQLCSWTSIDDNPDKKWSYVNCTQGDCCGSKGRGRRLRPWLTPRRGFLSSSLFFIIGNAAITLTDKYHLWFWAGGEVWQQCHPLHRPFRHHLHHPHLLHQVADKGRADGGEPVLIQSDEMQEVKMIVLPILPFHDDCHVDSHCDTIATLLWQSLFP